MRNSLGETTWVELDGRRDLLLCVALGSTEQHGPHLPLSTDTIIAEALCASLAERRPDVFIGPTLGIGASGEHQGFVGTLSIGTEVLASVLTELARSARSSFRGLVVVSGHGGNAEALLRFRDTSLAEGDEVFVFSPRVPGGDAHAGRTETSLLLALAPGLVRNDEIVTGVTTPLPEIANDLRSHGVAAVSSNGILGDPRGASAEEGRQIFASISGSLIDAVEEAFPR